jgi:hypothetical protein
MLQVLPILVELGHTPFLACFLGGLVLVQWRGPILVAVGIALIPFC